ncbi:MAG: SMC family ATPase [Candidatus Melainabacteria bacterium]|nr:SMC family ATPase [Candidatus Melainabacteria bacterium]
MSYADARLDLTSMPVACLTGPNGAGKSALLDAVTWTLWETSRSSSDELIRLGQNEMWVEVTFGLEGQEYRVKRSRLKSSSKGLAKSSLDLQMLKADGNSLSLTCPTIRQTQQRICHLLAMDYQTFVNSVYLRQGKADEFTTKQPAERKQVLAEILGLSYFDKLQDLAKDKSKELKAKSEVLETTLKALPDIEQKLEEVINELALANTAVKNVSEKLAFYGNSLASVETRWSQINQSKEKRAGGQSRIAELTSDIHALSHAHEETQQKLSELQALIAASPEIAQQAQELACLKAQKQDLEQKTLQLQQVTTRRLELQSSLASAQSRLEVELEHRQDELKELKEKKAQLLKQTADQQTQEAAYLKLKELLVSETDLAQKQETYIQLTNRASELQAQIIESKIRLDAHLEQKQTAQEELESIIASSHLVEEEGLGLAIEAQKLDKLETEFELVEEKGLAVKSELELSANQVKDLRLRQQENQEKMHTLEETSSSSTCPLCCAPIVDRHAVINHYQQQNKAIGNQIAELEETTGQLEHSRANLRKRYLELRKQLDTRKSLDIRIGQFDEKVSAVERAKASHQSLATEICHLKARLNDQDYAQIERESLVAVKAELYKLDFDPVIYANLQSQIRMQRHVETRYQSLKRDLTELAKLEQSIPLQQSKV